MPYYSKRDGSLEWIENNDTFMNWWYGFIKKEVKKHRDGYGNMPTVEVGVNEGKLLEDGTGRVVSPKFVEQLHNQGYKFNEGRNWFWREWSTWTPDGMKKVLETYQLSIEHKWIYKIVNAKGLGGSGGGGNANGCCIWESDEGSKE